jgi:uncharacterized membrane protein
MYPRSEILDWARQGRIASGGLRRALDLGAVLPTADEWRRFLDRLLLFLGAVLLASGVIFFFAFNWQSLGRFEKFGLVEAPILGVLAILWRTGIESAAGKATLLIATLLTGALLALVGQTYQTGADTFELFAAWAAAILPWVLVSRFPALWMVWLALVNLATTLYLNTFHGLLGIAFGPRQLWLLFALNTGALALWELAALGLEWLRERWAVRIIGTASGSIATVLALMAVLGWSESSGTNAIAWFAWLGATYVVYRHVVKDVYMLAGGALSVIVVVTAFLGKQMRMQDAPALLFMGLLVIGMSAAAGFWLRQVAAEVEEA